MFKITKNRSDFHRIAFILIVTGLFPVFILSGYQSSNCYYIVQNQKFSEVAPLHTARARQELIHQADVFFASHSQIPVETRIYTILNSLPLYFTEFSEQEIRQLLPRFSNAELPEPFAPSPFCQTTAEVKPIREVFKFPDARESIQQLQTLFPDDTTPELKSAIRFLNELDSVSLEKNLFLVVNNPESQPTYQRNPLNRLQNFPQDKIVVRNQIFCHLSEAAFPTVFFFIFFCSIGPLFSETPFFTDLTDSLKIRQLFLDRIQKNFLRPVFLILKKETFFLFSLSLKQNTCAVPETLIIPESFRELKTVRLLN